MTIEQAYGDHYVEMMKYAVYFLKNHHDAEDAVSECFLRLMRSEKLPSLDSGAQKAYIFTALRSVCFTVLRKRRHADVQEYEPSEPACDEKTIIKTDMQRAIAKLGEKSGKVMRLRFLHDLCIKDISETLGESENNVKIMIFRGKKQLAKFLGEQYAS